MSSSFKQLISQVQQCTKCADHLPHGVRPVLQAHPSARILIAGQAPGRKVHESGIPFDDASGNRLREWMGVACETFYDASKIAILPMGFCYPGTGKSGDLPPRPECEPAWRQSLLDELPNIELTLVLGKYALDYHFGKSKLNLTEQVKLWREHWPEKVALPHPSPRNNIWLKKNAWFERELVPELKGAVRALLSE